MLRLALWFVLVVSVVCAPIYADLAYQYHVEGHGLNPVLAVPLALVCVGMAVWAVNALRREGRAVRRRG